MVGPLGTRAVVPPDCVVEAEVVELSDGTDVFSPEERVEDDEVVRVLGIPTVALSELGSVNAELV